MDKDKLCLAILNPGLYQEHGRMAGYDWTIGEMDNVQPW
jgi:hypothetical protein